jgi:hypothetical protein
MRIHSRISLYLFKVKNSLKNIPVVLCICVHCRSNNNSVVIQHEMNYIEFTLLSCTQKRFIRYTLRHARLIKREESACLNMIYLWCIKMVIQICDSMWQYMQIPSLINHIQNDGSPKIFLNVSKSILTNDEYKDFESRVLRPQQWPSVIDNDKEFIE